MSRASAQAERSRKAAASRRVRLKMAAARAAQPSSLRGPMMSAAAAKEPSKKGRATMRRATANIRIEFKNTSGKT